MLGQEKKSNKENFNKENNEMHFDYCEGMPEFTDEDVTQPWIPGKLNQQSTSSILIKYLKLNYSIS